jgi:PTH1 family peptidyl-tRNA hydrolase
VKLIVGLGNPGRGYERTPHNIGFVALDELGRRLSCTFHRSFRFRVRAAKAVWDGKPLLLIKPQTYMNNSGSAVASVLNYHRLAPADLIVVLDDADLEFGQLRIRKKGRSGGHRGLASVVEALGTEDFIRVRAGIGRGGGGGTLTDHVLGAVRGETWERLRAAGERAAEAVLAILSRGAERAMNEYNARPEKPCCGRDGD